jgi:carboxyl-terminal processing protease
VESLVPTVSRSQWSRSTARGARGPYGAGFGSSFEDQTEYQNDAFREAVPSESTLATRPRFKTQSGRTVYGGGGIYPDVVVPDSPNLTRPEIDMITKRVFFDYANHMVTAKKEVTWKPDLLARDRFKLDEGQWKTLRDAIDKKGVKMNDSTWNAEKPFVLHQLRGEVAQQTMGGLERYKISVEEDTQLAKALELFPQAQKLVAGHATLEQKNRRRP